MLQRRAPYTMDRREITISVPDMQIETEPFFKKVGKNKTNKSAYKSVKVRLQFRILCSSFHVNTALFLKNSSTKVSVYMKYCVTRFLRGKI